MSTKPASATRAESIDRTRFRPSARRRSRVAAGALVAASAVGGNVLVYSSLGDKVAVLQVATTVRAGELVTADDLREVEVEVDPSVAVVAAADAAAVVGHYARVHLIAGSLIVAELVQSAPLVSAGRDVIAIESPAGRVPFGLTERSRVLIVVPTEDGSDPLVVEGRVVSRADGDADIGELTSLSVEVPSEATALIAVADDLRIALADPGTDVAYVEAQA